MGFRSTYKLFAGNNLISQEKHMTGKKKFSHCKEAALPLGFGSSVELDPETIINLNTKTQSRSMAAP
jgi:hypothetical protein